MDLCSGTGRCAAGAQRRSAARSLVPPHRVSALRAQPLSQRSGRLPLLVQASAAAVAGSPGNSGDEESFIQQLLRFPQAFWKFLRPHTIRGTILGTSAVTAKALLEHPECIDWGLLPRALLGLVALLCGNGYIVGINQIYDVDIDTVSKPYLPVASGELKPALAWALCLTLAAVGVTVVANNFGSLITTLYSTGLLLGTVYSVPPLRLKQFAIPAFMIIATVRGFLLNFGVYYATRAALQLPFAWSPAISFITVFVTVFAVVIAITKDLPDIAGDQANNIETFAARLGVQKVSWLATCLLLANYVGAVVLAFTHSASFNTPLMATAHFVLGIILVFRTLKLQASNYSQDGIQAYYRWIWNLFYSEYCLLPFV